MLSVSIGSGSHIYSRCTAAVMYLIEMQTDTLKEIISLYDQIKSSSISPYNKHEVLRPCQQYESRSMSSFRESLLIPLAPAVPDPQRTRLTKS